MKPYIYMTQGRWAVDAAQCPLSLTFARQSDAFEYAYLCWQTYLASIAFCERGWPASVH